jgi:hypothetical protein
LIGKQEGITRRRWEYHVAMDFKERGWWEVDWNQLTELRTSD